MCVVLNEELNTPFISIFEFLIHSFIKQLAVKAVPTRESSHECIERILARTQNDKLLKQLYSYSADKDRVIRTRVSNYVKVVCDHWDKPSLQRNLKDILKYLNQAQSDGESLVRKSARESVVALSQNFPAAIAQFYQAIDDQKLKKELEKLLPDAVHTLVHASSNTSLNLPNTPAARRSVNDAPVSKLQTNQLGATNGQPRRLPSASISARTPVGIEKRSASAGVPRVSVPAQTSSSHATTTEQARRANLRLQSDRPKAITPIREDSASHQIPKTRLLAVNSDLDPRERSQSANIISTPANSSPIPSRTTSGPPRVTTPQAKPHASPTKDMTPEEKEKRARMLASSVDLLGVTAEEDNTAQPSPMRSGSQTPGSNDLLTKLKSLREQVQNLPDPNFRQ
jgi:hypothetical protein